MLYAVLLDGNNKYHYVLQHNEMAHVN